MKIHTKFFVTYKSVSHRQYATELVRCKYVKDGQNRNFGFINLDSSYHYIGGYMFHYSRYGVKNFASTFLL